MAGFLSLLKKAIPHFTAAGQVITMARADGAKGAAVAVVKAVLEAHMADPVRDVALALAASSDDHQGDIEELKARIVTIEKELKTLRGKGTKQ